MSNDKQSSIDFLLKELEEIGVLNIKNCHWSDEVDIKKAIEQAKAMNKEQHHQTANVVRQAIFDLNYSSFDEYYNETFNND